MSELCPYVRRARRRLRPFLLLSLAAALAVGLPAAGSTPWDDPFAADAAAVLAAAAEVPPDSGGVDVLFSEQEVRLEADGRASLRYRLAYRVTQAAAIDGWGTVGAGWSPWHQERPEVRARVIAAGGREVWLDPATLIEQPVPSIDPTVFTDRRMLQGPLPGLAVGAVVVEERVVRDTAPYFAAGFATRYRFGHWVPVARERLVIDAPVDLPFHHESSLLPVQPQRHEAEGRVRWTWDVGPQAGLESIVVDAPGDVVTQPSVAWATGASWETISAAYARWVDERTEDAELPPEALAAVAAADGRRGKIAAALDWLHREVRYVSLALGDAGIVPRAPAETLARQYGDCKDKSTLLVALLRQAGVDAELALLATGPGLDVDLDLPGLGLFDHVIVHLPEDTAAGEPELWIDATVAEARVGLLPAADRGRQALLVRAAGGGLRRTPTAVSSDHVIRLEREVTLGDWGDGRDVSEEHYSGDFEIFVRSNLAALRTDEESAYADAEIAEPPADDPRQPLVVRFAPRTEDVSDTDLEWATYLLDTTYLLDDLPLEVLPDEDGGEAEERRFDLEVATPYVSELVLRVVPPAGFVPVDLPAEEDRPVGVARFERRVETADDDSVRVTLRFDSGPARWTPAEVVATREAIAELGLDEGLEVRFRSQGLALLAEGRAQEAVRELRGVADAEPRASHRARLAQALLSVGLGDAARREARAAVELDPKSSVGHQTLGFVLVHDLLGRQFQPGIEPTEAEAAFRRALELDPADTTSTLNLAILLEHDDDAVRYGRGARLDEAIEGYRTLRDELGLNEYDHNLLVALWQAGRFEEAAALAAEGTVPAARGFSLAAIAATRGAPAALSAAAKTPDAAARREELTTAAALLVQARLYPLAAELTAASAQGAPDAAARLARLALQRKLVHHETIEGDAADPRWAVFRAVRAIMLGEEVELAAILDGVRQVGGDAEGEVSEVLHLVRRTVATTGFPPDVFLDLWNASVEVQQTGAPEVGYRLALRTPFGNDDIWFLAPGPGGELLPVANGSDDGGLLGRQALRHLEAGRLQAARQWLDWAREEARVGSADDPWSGDAISMLWRRGLGGDETAIRRAASALVADGADAAEVVERLEEWLAAGGGSEQERRGLEIALADAYGELERWPDLARLARGWIERTPHAVRPFLVLRRALIGSDDLDALVELAEQRLEEMPQDLWALRALADVASFRRDLAASRRALERLIGSSGASASDFHRLAWLALFDGGAVEPALEHAHRAIQGGGGTSALHTLASLLAELDRPLEAKDVILQALEAEAPQPHDWFVFGRIAESFGEPEAALAAYLRVEKPQDDRNLPLATWTLAQRRLASLAGRAEAEPGASARHAVGEEALP